MKYEAINANGWHKYVLDDGKLTIIKKKKDKIIYDGSVKDIIILRIEETKDKKYEYLRLHLSLPTKSAAFEDVFKGSGPEDARIFVDELKNCCEYLDLSLFKTFAYRRSNTSSTGINTVEADNATKEISHDLADEKLPAAIQETEPSKPSLSRQEKKELRQENKRLRHEEKRNSVIKKVESGMILFDIPRGLIHDGANKTLPHIKGSNIVMKRGEICHYCTNVEITKTKNTVVGNVRTSTGVSVRAAKGLYGRVGQSQTQVVRADVTEKTSGMLYITNMRLVLTSSKYGFDKPLSDLTGITPYTEGIGLQFNDKIFNLIVKRPVLVSEIIAVAIENL